MKVNLNIRGKQSNLAPKKIPKIQETELFGTRKKLIPKTDRNEGENRQFNSKDWRLAMQHFQNGQIN